MSDLEKPPDSDDVARLRTTGPRDTAAGVPSIYEAVRHAFGKMGVVRGARGLLNLNQRGGVDCQSCAWPDPDEHRTLAEFCESGAKAMSDEGTRKRIGSEFFATHSIEQLLEKDDHWLNAQGRLTEPMLRPAGASHYEPVSWDQAFTLLAAELNGLASPDEAVFYTSGRTSNEAAFLFQLFVRQFGTNNLPDCSNMCHESSGVALSDTLGLGKATVRLSDFNEADLVIVIGQNPGTNAPRMMSSLQDAKEAGAKMIAINPLPEAGLMNFINPNPQHYSNPLKFPIAILGNRPTQLADLHLPVRIGGDMAVLKGMMKVMLDRERAEPGTVFDHDFIERHTSGYAGLIAALDATEWSRILDESGLEMSDIAAAAEMVMSADRVITCWAMGLTQHRRAVDTIKDVVNLHLLNGQIGKAGAGLCPVRGHSNVQGDRTMGIWEKVNERFFNALERTFGLTPPRRDGYNTVETIAALTEGRVGVFFAMGGNFAVAAPDSGRVLDGLRKCRLTAHVLTKLNRTALACGERSLILPCLGRSEVDIQAAGEQFVSTESTMLNVQMSRGLFKPTSEHLRSEPWIVCQLAKSTLGDRSNVDWDGMAADYDNIRNAIEQVIPAFHDYNARVRTDGGFYLPCPPRDRVFDTDSGKAMFSASTLDDWPATAPGQLLLTTIRSHDQFNTTIYGLKDRYRGVEGSRLVIFMNGADIDELGLRSGQLVDVHSHFEGATRSVHGFAIVPYPIPRGCAAAYFPEANPLVPFDSYAEGSGTPTSKSLVVTIVPAAAAATGDAA